MSGQKRVEAEISPEEKKRREDERKKAVAEAQKKAEEAKRKAEVTKRQLLNDLQNQSKQIAEEKTKMASLVSWKNQVGSQINTELEKVTQSKKELDQISSLINSSQEQLDNLISSEKQLHEQINTLIAECTMTKEEAINTKKIWKNELNKAQTNMREINPLFEKSNKLSADVYSSISKTINLMQSVEHQELLTTQKFDEIAKQETEHNEAIATLSFIDANKSLSTSAFVTLQALKNNNYQLREAISDGDLTAWFEKVDKKGVKKKVFVKLSKAFHEADEWLEELTAYEGFEGDECIDENENILEEMEKLGVKYEITSSKYPLPPKSTEIGWSKRLKTTSQKQKSRN